MTSSLSLESRIQRQCIPRLICQSRLHSYNKLKEKRAILIALFNSSLQALIPDKFIVSYLMTKVHYFDSLVKKKRAQMNSLRVRIVRAMSQV